MSTRASTAPRLEPSDSTPLAPREPGLAPLIDQLKKMIAHELDVRIDESQIDATMSLHEDGLALDSMVLFEFLNLIEKRYGFEFADQNIRPEVFANLTVLAAHIQGELARAGKSIPA
jgi:acyl carrier protein